MPDPQGRRLPRVSQFRHGELVVLFRRNETPPGWNDNRDGVPRMTAELNDPQFYSDMVTAFAEVAGVKLPQTNPFIRGGRPDAFVALRRQGEVYGFGQVALDGVWVRTLEDVSNSPRASLADIKAADVAVPPACVALNGARQKITVRGWHLVAATPHWRVKVLNSEGAGSPGGRPVKALTPKLFPSGNPPTLDINVKDEVGMRLDPGTTVDLDCSTGVRVAIFDTWPMADENIPIGGQPANPLLAIKTFVTNIGGAQNNIHLSRAVNRELVTDANPNMFWDYVSAMPQAQRIPVRGYNHLNHEFAPFFDVSDHGLFVAGIIRDIARKVELAVYRVLSERGTTDLATLVRALDDAIGRAEDDKVKLVINMSLALGPPMRVIKRLLQDPVNMQEMGTWGLQIEDTALDPNEYYSEATGEGRRLNDDELVMRTVDADGVPVWRLTGPLSLIDYLFRLDDHPNVLVVASAGNNSDYPSGKMYGPRMPAFVEGVLGVSSTGAYYSNHDDIEQNRDDGMGARGGWAATPPGSDNSDTVQGRGVVGPGITPYLPPRVQYWPGDVPIADPNERANDDGWIEWAGTSFAAPIVSGLAALVWCHHRYKTSRELLHAMVGRPPRRHRNTELRQVP